MKINKIIKKEQKSTREVIELDYPLKTFDHMISVSVMYEKGKLIVFIEYESKQKTTLSKYC